VTELPTLTMSYEALVEAGRAAREQADNVQWVEGDLARQVEALPADERPRDSDGRFIEDEARTLKRYAEDVDIPYGMVQEYRRVAQAWPTSLRRDVAWQVHKALAAQDDRFELIREGMTVREAQDIVRRRNAASRGKPGWFELLGTVADTLAKADKQLAKAEAAIDRAPNRTLRTKAHQYAQLAEEIAARLRGIEEWS